MLPIAFPRFFTPNLLSQTGAILPPEDPKAQRKRPDEFVLSVPSLVRLKQDAGYSGVINKAYDSIRKMKISTKMQLLKENHLEEDELKEIVERLASLSDTYKGIACDSEEEDEQDGNSMDSDDY